MNVAKTSTHTRVHRSIKRPGEMTAAMRAAAAPARPFRPQLPLAATNRLGGQIDWNLTILAAFSFLLHFGAVGAMCSDWADPIVDTQATAGGIVDLVSHLAPPPPERPKDSDDIKATDPVPKAPPASPTASTHREAAAHDPSTTHPATAEAALLEQAKAMEVSALLALQAPGTAAQRALDMHDTPMVDLGASARSPLGARQSTGQNLSFGAQGSTVVPGSTSTSLRALGVSSAHTSPPHAGKETETVGPMVQMSAEPIPSAGGRETTGASRVVASLRAGFRRCYDVGLGIDPTMSGKVMLSARIAPNGEVASAEASDNTGLSDGVVTCLVKRIRTAQFDGGASATTLRVPVTFVRQAR
jgi:hypothetical protein